MSISTRGEEKNRRTVWLLAILCFGVQMMLAAATEGYSYDMSCFTAWSARVASLGPANFYAPDYFCDYPPGYILMLWLPGKILGLMPAAGETARRVLFALWPALGTALCGPVVYQFACKRTSPAWALRCAAAAMFCPAMLFDSGVWGQIDGVFTLAILFCFVFLEDKRWLAGAACFGVALVIKPQALLAGPPLAICFLLPVLFSRDNKARLEGVKNGILGVLAALAPVLVCGVFFWGIGGAVPALWEKYTTTTASYPYATINAANLIGFLGGEWKPQTNAVYWFGIPLMSWQTFGTLLVLLLSVWTFVWAMRAYKNGRFSPLLTVAVYTVGVFTLSHRMHERYLVFTLILIIAAAAAFNSRRLLGISWGLSLTSLFNMAQVYSNVGGEDEFLASALNQLVFRFTGLAETVLFFLLAWQAWALSSPAAAEDAADAAPRCEPLAPIGRAPAWTKKEALGLAGLTAAVALVSFAYLGEMTAPQNPVDTNGQPTASYTIETAANPSSVWVYAGISEYNNGHLTLTDAAGVVQLEMELDHSSTFKWNEYAMAGAQSPFTVEVENGQVFELSFRDENGQPVAVTGDTTSPLVDEQQLVPQRISQMNSFYFDEIYHARTGYEHLHKMKVYETTHPPMGKNFIALGIAIFGMTGFGWRFFGTLFGVLMVPALYDFVRRLTKKPHIAGFAAVLLALDFMRFSQTRLATIDSYVVLFILLGADMMLWYCTSVLEKGVGDSLLPMALGGVAFGFGCASKWTGMYAGVGLAILYFGVLWQRGKYLLTQPDGKKKVKNEVQLAIAGGVLFYVVTPLLIYLASYLPYLIRDPGFGLDDWWRAQESMYWYHSTLEATHSFSSQWYTWLLDARPVWYYSGHGVQDGIRSSIAGFISPALMLAGMIGWLRLAYRQLVGKGSRAGGLVIVVTLSSLLPWVLVTRCTFLYHMFPCVPMLAAAAALMLSQWEDAGHGDRARFWSLAILGAAALLFVWFYPVLSGIPTPSWWLDGLRWLPTWGF